MRMESIPITGLDSCLWVTLQGDTYERLALALQQDLCEEIVKHQATCVLLDISSLDVLDTFIAGILGSIGSMAQLLGAETVLVGMRPTVAMTLVELGLSLGNVDTALDVDKGLELLESRVGSCLL